MSEAETPTPDTEDADVPQGEQAAEPGEPKTEEPPSLDDQLATVKVEREEYHDKWLRAEAELDNARKRMRKDAEQARKYQSLALAEDLLPGMDNLSRALDAAAKSNKVEDLIQGVQMVLKQFEDTFARHSVSAIPSVGETFDPNLHEALQQLPADEPPMTIIQELERGFRLHDRVLRPSKVIVSSGPANDDAGESS